MSVYPTGIDSFTTKIDNVNDVVAADVNNLQDSVVAIETFIGTGSSNFLKSTGNVVMDSGTTFAPYNFYIQNPFNAVTDNLTVTSIGTGITWTPSQIATNVTAMNIISGVLYVGGIFNQVSGNMRTGLAAFDIADGYTLTNWAPQLMQPIGTNALNVNQIISSPNGIIVAGKFSGVNATIRQCLAEIGTNGSLTSFYNSLLPTGSTTAVEMVHITGNNLYAAGTIASISGSTVYKNLVAFNKHTGELNYQFTPGVPSAITAACAVESGIYFGSTGAANISGMGAGPKANPLVDYSGNGVPTLSSLFSGTAFTSMLESPTSPGTIYIGHGATSKMVYHPSVLSLASPNKLDYVNRELKPFTIYWNENQSITKMIEYSGVLFYINDEEINYGSQSFGIAGLNVGAVNATTGKPLNFTLDLDQSPMDMLIYDNKLYLCGPFRCFQHNKQPVSHIIAIDLPDSLFA